MFSSQVPRSDDSRAARSDSEATEAHSHHNDLLFHPPLFCYRPNAFSSTALPQQQAACPDEFSLFSNVNSDCRQNANVGSEQSSEPTGESIGRAKPAVPNYNLKRTLFVYFYHRKNVGHYAEKYPISDYELRVLKRFLIKKLIQDKRKFKLLSIQRLTQENYTEFLLSNPAVYRKNIIKSKLFKKIIKQMKRAFPDLESRYLGCCNDRNRRVFEELGSKKAYNMMTNEFYQSCFENAAFNRDFADFLNDKKCIGDIVRESKRKFARKVDDWIEAFSEGVSNAEAASLKVRLNSSRDEIDEGRRCFLEYMSLVSSAGF